MHAIRRAATLVSAFVLAAPAAADELHVPSAYPTIQAAVTASQAGDEIVLADGEFSGAGNHDIVMPAHAITLRSASGDPGACIVQMIADPYVGEPTQRALHFTPASSSETVVRDIMLRGGSGGDGPSFFPVGGAVLVESCSPTFEGVVFQDNLAFGECTETAGGAVYLAASSATFDQCVFRSNWAGGETCLGFVAGSGGGAYVSGGSPRFTDCLFRYNVGDGGEDAGSGRSGGLHVTDGADVVLTRTQFRQNRAGYGAGGALGVFGATVRAVDCDFIDNHCFEGRGGAIVVTSGYLELAGCTLASNWVEGGFWRPTAGGAMWVVGGTVAITNCLIADNSVEYEAPYCDAEDAWGAYGGAIFLTGDGAVFVRSSTLVGNNTGAYPCAGGAIYVTDSRAGGAFQTLRIAGSIIRDSGPQPLERFGPGAEVLVRYSNITGGWPGAGNIDADPLFADPAAGDYRLGAGSPCIDSGDNTAVPAGILTDLAGLPRFVDDPATPDTGAPGGAGGSAVVDMGAYEFQGDSCYADCDGSGSLDFFDFLCFQNLFAAGDPETDCDASGELDFFDFLCFQNAFAAGCP